MFSEVQFINQLINSCSEIGETKTIYKGGSLKKGEEIWYYSAAYKWFTAWKLVSKNICQIDKVRPVEFDF